jgi:hypothetical protein
VKESEEKLTKNMVENIARETYYRFNNKSFNPNEPTLFDCPICKHKTLAIFEISIDWPKGCSMPIEPSYFENRQCLVCGNEFTKEFVKKK